MSDVIKFLERIGQDARLRDDASRNLDQVLRNANLPADVQDALRAADQAALERALGAKENVCCIIAHGNEDEEDREPGVRAA